MYTQNKEAAEVSYPCDLPSNFILHINKHARFEENTQSLLVYTDISIYLVFNRSYFISMAMNAFASREFYMYLAAGWVRDLQAWRNHAWQSISIATICIVKFTV